MWALLLLVLEGIFKGTDKGSMMHELKNDLRVGCNPQIVKCIICEQELHNNKYTIRRVDHLYGNAFGR